MKCLGCPNEKIFARGYCARCYTALRRNGTLERRHISNSGMCSVDGCERHAFAKGFCARHYQQKRHHPLRSVWRNLRSRAHDSYPAEWENFDLFLAAVGDRPSPKHQLRRVNTALPWSIENAEWLPPVGVRANDPEYKRLWHRKNKRGLPDGGYEAMFAAQEGKCPACQLPLERMDEKERPVKICIDHDHKTDLVRGLLCDPCNKGLGLFRDDAETLRRMITYLEKDNGKKD